MFDWIERGRFGQEIKAAKEAAQRLATENPGKTFRVRRGREVLAEFKVEVI